MTDINEFASNALATAMDRERKGQLKSDTMSLLKHCAGEVVEASEAYARWRFPSHSEDAHDLYKEDFAMELADVITCALIAAAKEKIDIKQALIDVQKKNARRAG